jgi:hypothetical protein
MTDVTAQPSAVLVAQAPFKALFAAVYAQKARRHGALAARRRRPSARLAARLAARLVRWGSARRAEKVAEGCAAPQDRGGGGGSGEERACRGGARHYNLKNLGQGPGENLFTRY